MPCDMYLLSWVKHEITAVGGYRLPQKFLITFCVRHSWGEMYVGHGCLSVCPSLYSHSTAHGLASLVPKPQPGKPLPMSQESTFESLAIAGLFLFQSGTLTASVSCCHRRTNAADRDLRQWQLCDRQIVGKLRPSCDLFTISLCC